MKSFPDGSQCVRRATIFGRAYWENPDGNRSYEMRDIGGPTYLKHPDDSYSISLVSAAAGIWSHPDGTHINIYQDWLGNVIESHPDGRKTYLPSGFRSSLQEALLTAFTACQIMAAIICGCCRKIIKEQTFWCRKCKIHLGFTCLRAGSYCPKCGSAAYRC